MGGHGWFWLAERNHKSSHSPFSQTARSPAVSEVRWHWHPKMTSMTSTNGFPPPNPPSAWTFVPVLVPRTPGLAVLPPEVSWSQLQDLQKGIDFDEATAVGRIEGTVALLATRKGRSGHRGRNHMPNRSESGLSRKTHHDRRNLDDHKDYNRTSLR